MLSLLERCLQLGAIAKTVQHLLYLVRVIQAEVSECCAVKHICYTVKCLSRSTEGFYMYFYSVFF